MIRIVLKSYLHAKIPVASCNTSERICIKRYAYLLGDLSAEGDQAVLWFAQRVEPEPYRAEQHYLSSTHRLSHDETSCFKLLY